MKRRYNLVIKVFIVTLISICLMIVFNQDTYAEGGLLEPYYKVDNVYSSISSSTNFTNNGLVYTDRDGLSIRTKTTNQTIAGVVLPVNQSFETGNDSALIIDALFYAPVTRTLKVEIIKSDDSVLTMMNNKFVYKAKDNKVVSNQLTIGNNAFNNNLSSSTGYDATINLANAYNQLVIPFDSFGLTSGTLNIKAIRVFLPNFSTSLYMKFVLQSIGISNDFNTLAPFMQSAIWEAKDEENNYSLYENAATNFDIKFLRAGEFFIDPARNSSGNAVLQDLVLKFPDELINEEGKVLVSNLKGLSFEYLNTNNTAFNGNFKLYDARDHKTSIANSNYSNAKTHKITRNGTEADSNAKYFYPSSNAVGYADSIIMYNFDVSNNITPSSTESFFSATNDLPEYISPYFTLTIDNGTTLSLDGVFLKNMMVHTVETTVYENTYSGLNGVTVDRVKGYTGTNVVYKAQKPITNIDTIKLNNVNLLAEEMDLLFSDDGLEVLMVGDMHLDISLINIGFAFEPYNIEVNIDLLIDDTNLLSNQFNQAYGSTFTYNEFEDSNYEFVYWIVNGILRNDLQEALSIPIYSTLNIIGVYKDNTHIPVVFIDVNGSLIGIDYVEPGNNAIEPTTLPSKPGYKHKINKWDTSFENILVPTVVKLQYEVNTETTFQIDVINGIGFGEYDYNKIVEVSTTVPNFIYWLEDGKIVSYNRDYQFTALKNRTLIAVSGNATLKPLINRTENLNIRDGYESYLAQFYIPENYTLHEVGWLFSNDLEDFYYGSELVSQHLTKSILTSTNEYLISISNGTYEYVKAYLIVQNSLGQFEVFYS